MTKKQDTDTKRGGKGNLRKDVKLFGKTKRKGRANKMGTVQRVTSRIATCS